MSKGKRFPRYTTRQLMVAVGYLALWLGLTRAPFDLVSAYKLPQFLEGCLWGVVALAGASLGAAIGTIFGDKTVWGIFCAIAWPIFVLFAAPIVYMKFMLDY